MAFLKKITFILFPIALLISGCPLNMNPLNKDKPDDDLIDEVNLKETMEISISCNKDRIEEYIAQGWEVIETSTSEVACSWKTEKASKDCNIKRDKGCMITVPDLIGQEVRYILERDKNLKRQVQ